MYTRCLFVSRLYGPQDRVSVLASRLLADKTSSFARQIAGGRISAESRPVGSGRWLLTGLKQCSSAIVLQQQGDRPQPSWDCILQIFRVYKFYADWD